MTTFDKIKAFFDPEALPPDDRRHSERRRHDKWRTRGNWAWQAFNTILVVWAVLTLAHQIQTRDEDRVDGTEQRCEFVTAVIDTAVSLGVQRQDESLGKLIALEKRCSVTLEKLKEQAE